MKRTFESGEGASSQFWHIEREGRRVTVRFGRTGTRGETKLDEHPDEAAAIEECERLVREQLGKGYRETSPPAAPDALREVLEQALVEDPDDLASHAAYADRLGEQGDPRGEFIQVQLALIEGKRSHHERLRLQAREAELLGLHQARWLGPLADLLPPEKEAAPFRFSFARGWLDTVSFARLTRPCADALARSPQARLLRQLLIDTADDLDEATGCLDLLAASPYLGNVRILRIGEEIDVDFDEPISTHANGRGALRLIARLPHLEELYLLAYSEEVDKIFALPTLGDLRVLQVYHQEHYPLDILAANPAMRNLTALLCHPRSYSGRARLIELNHLQAVCESENLPNLTHLRLRLTELGDQGCRMLADSGMLKRLKILDQRLGNVTDEGARALANCPDIRNLELLNLSRNALTTSGVAELEETGINLIAESQHEAGDEEDEWYCVGDSE